MKIIFVGLGGFVGTVCRYLISLWMKPLSGEFPFGTLLINLVGAFLIGTISQISEEYTPFNNNLYLFLTVGVCGGFTTFSTFSLESVNLLEKGKTVPALVYMVISVVICITAVTLAKVMVKNIAQHIH